MDDQAASSTTRDMPMTTKRETTRDDGEIPKKEEAKAIKHEGDGMKYVTPDIMNT